MFNLKLKDIDPSIKSNNIREITISSYTNHREYMLFKALLKSVYTKVKDFEKVDKIAKTLFDMGPNRDEVLLLFSLINTICEDEDLSLLLSVDEERKFERIKKYTAKTFKRMYNDLLFKTKNPEDIMIIKYLMDVLNKDTDDQSVLADMKIKYPEIFSDEKYIKLYKLLNEQNMNRIYFVGEDEVPLSLVTVYEKFKEEK